MLEVENLAKSFPGTPPRRVLDGISLTLRAGEYVAIMGESGSGKSTLLNLIAGLDTPDRGGIALDGVRIDQLDDAARTRLRRARMGFVFQAFHLLPHLSAEANVALPLALNGVRGEAAVRRVEDMLDAVGMRAFRHAASNRLSGGEMQRIAVARALVHRPRLVLADEPTGNLDAHAASEVLALLRRQLQRDQAAGILVTHSEVAAGTADRIYVLGPDGLHLRSPQR